MKTMGVKNRKPILVLAVGIFWLGYVSISVTQYFNKMEQMVIEDNQRRLKAIEYHLFVAAPLMAQGQTDILSRNLEKAKEARDFDFYLLTRVRSQSQVGGGSESGAGISSEVVDFYNPGGTKEDIARLDFPLGFFRVDQPGSTSLGKAVQEGNLKLSMGVNMNGSLFAAKAVLYQKWDLIQDFTLVTLFLSILLYLILKDILDLTRILKSRDRKPMADIKARSKESQILLAATDQFEKSQEHLKLTNQTYAASLSPAVRNELLLGTKAPFQFDAYVIRLDVNGYTQMFLERKTEFVTSTLNRYFKKAAEVIRRYEGHIYQYVGDEIVFHIKVEGDTRSTGEEFIAAHLPTEDAGLEKAVSCVRSLFAVAQEMDQELRGQGVPFVVKAAMSRGRLRFIELDTGYAFAGLPLIESVRMLGKIDEKEQNILAIYSDDYVGVRSLAQEYKTFQVAFKGFQGQTEIVEIKDFIPIQIFLEQKNLAVIKWFRSDADLVTLMEFLGDQIGLVGPDFFIKIDKILRHFEVEEVPSALAQSYERLLTKLIEWTETRPNDENWNVVLSSLIALGAHLLKSLGLSDSLRALLELGLKHQDPRVRGNSVLTLDELSPETYSFHELLSHPTNRVVADVLLAQGRRDLQSQVFHQLKQFLYSENPFFVASGIYVLSYLYDYHRDRDPVYFKANPYLQQIPLLIEPFLSHNNVMVQKRAEISMGKVA
ncbi:MAG: hypothetical protein K1X29_02930 [Bdellovibrionales bacterium]|nr:hypothetical protein [Bdellovibrionales bacterium]